MHFDDRLATVLRHRANSAGAARTQFRQLVDLLGAPRSIEESAHLASAWLRLGALGEAIAPQDRAVILRDPALRIRNPALVMHLAEDEPEVAAAVLSRARLDDTDWQALIPRLPIRARGFLRLRRDLGTDTLMLLERLGIHDRGLPTPVPAQVSAPVADPVPDLAEPAPLAEDSEIGALVRRIEQFRRARTAGGGAAEAPRLPLGDRSADPERGTPAGFAFTADAEGRIDWADPEVAPALIGTRLAEASPAAARAIAARQPIVRTRIDLDGASVIAGPWLVDAAPRFAEHGGHFTGHAGRFRRTAPSGGVPQRSNAEADRLRQLLHELRTPVNAIQGFAEVIQQQLFGAVPHEYRAHAASIAGDSARLLAGFEELDRLARLETGALLPEPGNCDLAAVARAIIGQLQPVLGARMAGFATDLQPGAMPVGLVRDEAEALVWRLLATMAGAAGGGEQLALTLQNDRSEVRLMCDLPATLAAEPDVFAASARPTGGALSAGAFGAGFALRLARAEANAAGGALTRIEDTVTLALPLLTGRRDIPSPANETAREREAG